MWAGTLLGIGCVALSKAIKFYGWLVFLSEGGSEFVFEIGVALIGAAVTAYPLGILLKRQPANAKQWRKELRIDPGQLRQPASDERESNKPLIWQKRNNGIFSIPCSFSSLMTEKARRIWKSMASILSMLRHCGEIRI
jgi:hypothetical protein